MADRGDDRHSRREPGRLVGNEHPRRFTMMRPTREAEQATQAERFSWLSLCLVDEERGVSLRSVAGV
ncbi:MAG: hypothetical protein E6J34_18230 [Chloroflexi bacterium]|nr:MAG: hypothetical protein E6J34_18230 [Chloroflexota bacterium]